MDKKNKFAKTILFLFSLSIVIPTLTILLWVFVERWSWPDFFPRTYSLRAIKEILGRTDEFIPLLLSSVLISTVVSLLSVIIGVMTSRALILYEFKGKSIIFSMTMLPFLIPTTVFALGIHVVFIKWGLNYTVTGVIISHLIFSLPYATVLLMDGTKGIGNKLEEQARVLGASTYESFFKVTLPLLIPVILSAYSMAYIISFSQYFLTLLIGGGNIKTFTIVMVPYLQGDNRNIAFVYSAVFLLITVLVFRICQFIANKYIKSYKIDYYS